MSDLLLSVVQFIVALKAFTPLTYLAAASGYPLVDSASTRPDVMFGFEWNIEANWVANHPTFDWLLHQAYFSLYYQGALVCLVGSVSHPGDRNGEIIWQFCISLALTCVIFVFTPALGHVAHIGTGWIKALMMIRNGEWNYFRLFACRRHHQFSVLPYDPRNPARVRGAPSPLAAGGFRPLNMLLIVATLSVGGHYLVDLPAGAAVAVISIAATRLLRRQLAKFRLRGPRSGGRCFGLPSWIFKGFDGITVAAWRSPGRMAQMNVRRPS